MFFNSSTFLFGFLPIVLAGFFLLERTGSLLARQAWLLAASLVFYAWSNSTVLALFLPLTAINYLLGSRLQRSGSNGGKWLLVLAVGINVLALCYFKYANFFVTNLNAVLQTNLFIEKILLPLGISFITFMQIAWLVACRRGESVPCSYFEFLLFSAFFPQIVSGPIVYQRETLPQFRKTRTPAERSADICVGVTLFTMGLAKKVLVAELAKDSAFPVPHTDQILAEAIASGKKDVYLSNDSHWGSIGHKLFADALADHLGAPAQKPE
jgi:alginate O-acetyltransferase complex protein AlgI